MIIQLLLVPALVFAVVSSLRSRTSLRGQAHRKILAVLTVVAGVLAVMFPNTLQALANWTGVTRGTDLLLYGLALVIIYLVGSTSVRFREQEARLVLLARQVALADAALRHVEAVQARSQQPADPTPVAAHHGGGAQADPTTGGPAGWRTPWPSGGPARSRRPRCVRTSSASRTTTRRRCSTTWPPPGCSPARSGPRSSGS